MAPHSIEEPEEVLERLPVPHLSHSQINRYLTCPEQYRLYYVEKLRPRIESGAMVFGALIHVALADFFRAGTNPVDTFLREWGNLKSVALRYNKRESWDDLREKGGKLLQRFLAGELAKIQQVHSVEKKFDLTITSIELPFVGLVDLIATVDGQTTIVDFKTAASDYEDHEVSPSIDALQEFKVETSSYSADTGASPGGQVNLITKSGTNSLHGSAWEFNRNSAFSALPAFDRWAPSRKPSPLNRNQFGANLGGPVDIPKVYNGKDRTFFFFNWESGRLVQGSVGTTAYIPQVVYRSGDFSSSSVIIYDPQTGQPFPGNKIPPNRIRPFASKYMTFVPPTNFSAPGVNYISATTAVPTTQNQYIGRIDQRVSDKNLFSGSYAYNVTTTTTLPTFVWDTITNSARAQNLSLGDVHSFSATVVNQARIGWNRFYEHQFFGTTDNPALNIANIIGIAGVATDPRDYGPPAFTVSGYTLPTVRSNGPRNRVNQIWQFSDNISIQKGNHAMRVGVDILRRNATFDQEVYPRGTFTFDGRTTTLNGATPAPENGLAAFLLGLADSALVSAVPTATRLNSWWEDYYFQDDWKVTRALTLNLGMRYDYFAPPVQRGAMTNFALNGVIPGMVPSQQVYHDVPGKTNTPGWPDALTYPDRRDWGPRVGFAWRVPHISDFVVRGGYGIYYTPEINNSYQDLTLGVPIVAAYNITTTYNAPFFADTVFATPPTGAAATAYSFDFIVDPHIRSAYGQEWNLTVQKRLPRNLFLNIGYVGSAGNRLVESWDSNRPIQILTPGPGVPSVNSRRPFQGYGSLGTWKGLGTSTYNSLQIELERRVARGFTLLSAYTYSHNLSSSDGSSVGESAYGGGIQDIYHHNLDKADAETDQRHRLSASAIYELPFFTKASARPVRTLLGGWQLGTIVTEQTGVSAAVGGLGDTTGTGVTSRPMQLAGQSPMLSRSQRTKARWFNTADFTATPLGQWGDASRQPLHVPGFNNVDASLFKNFRFRESGNVQFRWELFNFFNHVQLGAPGLNVLSPATFGIITSSSGAQGMPGDKRIMQFALKLQF